MWSLLIHGGAGSAEGTDANSDTEALEAALVLGCARLEAGDHALDVVEAVVRALEDCGRFIAGKGSCPNEMGRWELDACLCNGEDGRIGAVAALEGYYPPSAAARAVMEHTKNVLIVGEGAGRFAHQRGLAPVGDPQAFFLPACTLAGSADEIVHGTVGAVVLDSAGRLAAGTSTGGTIGKRAGRVGDSPIAGAGTWADRGIAVSCTGQGEYFLRTAAAYAVAARHDHLDEAPGDAVAAVLGRVLDLGGEGGMIAIDRDGRGGCAYTTEFMRFGMASARGQRTVRVARRPERCGPIVRIL